WIGPATPPTWRSTAAWTSRTLRRSSRRAPASSWPAPRCSTLRIRNGRCAISRRPPPALLEPRPRGDRSPVHFPTPRALRRDRPDGRGLLRELSRVVRSGSYGPVARERLELPRNGSRRLLASSHRGALRVQSLGEVRRRHRREN